MEKFLGYFWLGKIFSEMVMVHSIETVKIFPGPKKNFIAKYNHIGLAVSEFFRYRQTDKTHRLIYRHPVTFLWNFFSV